MPKPARRPVPDMRPDHFKIVARLGRNSAEKGGCIVWTGHVSAIGYGAVSWRHKSWMVHRLLYASIHGAFDKDLDIMHTCDVRACITPEHLRLGTIRDNMRDSVDKRRAKNSKKTHCPKGHDYDVYGQHHGRQVGYKPWRVCGLCAMGKWRARRGWPEKFWYIPALPFGHRLDFETGEIYQCSPRWGRRPSSYAPTGLT